MNIKDLHIETERLTIRPYKIEDAPAFKKAIDYSLPELIPFMPWAKNNPSPIDAQIELIKKWTKEIEENKSYILGLFLKNGAYVGSSGYNVRGLKSALEIGYWVNTKYEKQGYISESIKALTTFAFNNLNAERIEIHCDNKNFRSFKVAEKAGYKHEFTYRLIRKDELGERIKHQVWYMFKEDWNQ